MANNNIDLIDLDPNSLKASFKNYLRGNNLFKDYDFDGSNINLLLDLLSYNTYKNAFFINMAISEGFLDSAVLRSSVLSHAKHLNYLPRSFKSSKARVKVSFEATSDTAPYLVAKGSPFTSIVKNDSYTYTVPENIVVASANNTFEFETDIYEGIFVKDTYNFGGGTSQIFPITNKNVDLDSLTVTIFEDSNIIGTPYIFSTSLLGIDNKSKVFFLQPSIDDGYEVIFGDDNLGRKPKQDSTVVLEYRVSSGPIGDGARIFSMDFDPTENDELVSSITVSTLQSSMDGALAETNESIKKIAPRHFQAQERAVTASDYSILLKGQFPEINDIYAYGGEDLVPPEPGKVFVSVDISGVDGLPTSKINSYTKFLSQRTPFGTTIKFIQPEFSYLQVGTNIRYNINITNLSGETLKGIVRTTILEFRDNNLDAFNVSLRHSKLESIIDQADQSILSSVSEFILYKKKILNFSNANNFDVNFQATLTNLGVEIPKRHNTNYPHAVYSSPFYYNNQLCRIEDDGNSKLVVVKLGKDNHDYILPAGTVDYTIGRISVKNLVVSSIIGDSFKIFVNAEDNDITAYTNNILTIENDAILINVEGIRV